ncbi:hypothetical protein ACRYCC_39520 [Actinomadura scrupuli]|uniref:hypothetical protein n=1 Tax=Actinomadura scrupuli TaxID=559629 RepID=UPI003D99B831
MDERPVAFSDLTQLDGEPTSRATPHIERIPIRRKASGGATAAPAGVLAGMAVTAGITAIGLWIGSPTLVITICWMITILVALAIGVSRRR